MLGAHVTRMKQKSRWNGQSNSWAAWYYNSVHDPPNPRTYHRSLDQLTTTGPLCQPVPPTNTPLLRPQRQLYGHLKLPKRTTTCALADHPVTFHACVVCKTTKQIIPFYRHVMFSLQITGYLSSERSCVYIHLINWWFEKSSKVTCNTLTDRGSMKGAKFFWLVG